MARQVGHLDRCHRRVGDRDRDLHHHRGFGPPVGVLRVPRHHGDQGVLARPERLHDAGGVDAHRTAAAREEDHGAVHGAAVGVADLGLEGGRRPHLERQLARGDDEFGRLGGGRLLFFLRERREGEKEQRGGRKVDGMEKEGSGHGRAVPRRSGIYARPAARAIFTPTFPQTAAQREFSGRNCVYAQRGAAGRNPRHRHRLKGGKRP